MSSLRMAQGRLRISFFLVLVVFFSFFVRLVFVQAVNAQDRAHQAARELNQTVDLPAPRGDITDRNGNVLARSIDALDLVVDQNLIGDPEETAKLVAPIINASTSAIESRLTGTRKFVYIAKDITPAQWLKIKEAIASNNSGKPMSEAKRNDYKTIGGSAWLDGEYTVYGEVVEGLDVIDKIAAVPCGQSDRPVTDLRMKMVLVKIKISPPH